MKTYKIIASAIVASATLLPQISAAKIALFQPVSTYEEDDEKAVEVYQNYQKYLYKNKINPNVDQLMNATNIHNIHTYLLNLPELLENELNAKLAYINTINRKINRSIASQMAVSNLFQPYSIGKFNLSAATGGYKSEYSLAVGTGYRFNQHIAVRASASFVRGGSVAYGAGVNFEY